MKLKDFVASLTDEQLYETSLDELKEAYQKIIEQRQREREQK